MSVNKSILQKWVVEQISSSSRVICSTQLDLVPLAGDAGFRQYFQVNTVPAALAVMAPKTEGVSESAGYFSDLSVFLRSQGIVTPLIFACDREQNYLLIEHLGECALLDELSADNANALYTDALMTLLKLQKIPAALFQFPAYSPSLLHQEMDLFGQWFVEQLLSYSLSDQEERLLNDFFEWLSGQAISQPQVLVHRDYHSRNLIYRPGEAVGVIDFQDAVWGPITYDLVSLLRDCYIRWSPDQVRRWVLMYYRVACEQGVLTDITEGQFMQWFDTMGLQRHIKVLGVFARLSLRDGKHGYLQDVPLVIRYILEVAESDPQTQYFAQWFKDALLPRIAMQAWYVPYSEAGGVA